VVIDDALAFCGGIDMTDDRWDTRDHADQDTRRGVLRRWTGRRDPLAGSIVPALARKVTEG
jgi:phosphatidylserine/phosphatidylglycerophosphate/cardiolipin synthase-like enzyme